MPAILHLLRTFIANLFKSQRRLEVENLFLRHRLNIALMPVCVSRVGARSTTAALVRGDPAPDRGVAGAATRGGIPVGTVPTYLVRDNDRACGEAFTNRVRAMGIRDRPISPRSPWQNPYAERLIGTLRRDC